MFTFRRKIRKAHNGIAIAVILILQIMLIILLMSSCGIDTSTIAGSVNQVTESQSAEEVDDEDEEDFDALTEEDEDEAKANYTVYVTRTGEKYHSDGCRYLKSIGGVMTQAEALQRGYEPCSKCINAYDIPSDY